MTPLTRDQLDAGLMLLDRMRHHVFDVDPNLDRDESFDVGMLLGYLVDAVQAERALVDFAGELRDTCPFTLHYVSDLDFAWIDLVLMHFRLVDIRYLEAALYSVCHQRDLSRIGRLVVYDNDSADREADIRAIVEDHTKALPPHITVEVLIDKHGDETKRTHPYCVNQAMRMTGPDWVFYTRTDYVLHRDAVWYFTEAFPADEPTMLDVPLWWRGFITSHVYHQALDARMDQRAIGFRDIEVHGWRTHPSSTDVLLQKVQGWYVDSSDLDAAVWLTRRSLWRETGGLNEKLIAWGFPQTVWQKALRDAGVTIVQIPKALGHHMHHGGTYRNYDAGKAELEAEGISVESLKDFRDISGLHGGVCDELGPLKPQP